MRTLPLPHDARGVAMDPENVYSVCISGVREAVRQAELVRFTPDIRRAASDLDQSAQNGFQQITIHSTAESATAKDGLVSVYTERMARQAAPGRRFYDKILSASLPGNCPLCDIREASTIDHYLEKSAYPLLAVVPNNLVPACRECNFNRNTSGNPATFHPYFNREPQGIWLRAKITESAPLAVKYEVVRPADWPEVELQRVIRHFVALKLEVAYSRRAATLASEHRYEFARTKEIGGVDGLRNELNFHESEQRRIQGNSWKAAFFSAAAISDWFCNGGFELGY